MKNVCDVNENSNNAIGIDWQNNNLECKDH